LTDTIIEVQVTSNKHIVTIDFSGEGFGHKRDVFILFVLNNFESFSCMDVEKPIPHRSSNFAIICYLLYRVTSCSEIFDITITYVSYRWNAI